MGCFKKIFNWMATRVACASGHPAAFLTAVSVVLVWAVTGPLFHFSDTWQLVINTGTTIVTFLMVFLIQNTQNRDNEAIQLKLDELIRSTSGAHNFLLNIEDLTEEELQLIKKRYSELAVKVREELKIGKKDLGNPEIRLSVEKEKAAASKKAKAQKPEK